MLPLPLPLPPRLTRRRYALLPLLAGLASCLVLLVYLVTARPPDSELDAEIDLTAFQLVRLLDANFIHLRFV